MEKYHFSILAQNRLKIDSIAIMGRDRDEAERKLRQMYRYCEVLSCEAKTAKPVFATGKLAPIQKKPYPQEPSLPRKHADEEKGSMEQILALIANC